MKKRDLKLCSKVLVVEGYSDLTFYAEFLEKLGKFEGVFIQNMGGRERLVAELETFISPPLVAEKTHIGVILDNDDDSPDFANRIKEKLGALTQRDLTEGQWAQAPTGAKVGFFVAPEPGETGEIEDLVWRAFTEDPRQGKEIRCVEDFISCMNAGTTAENRRIAKRRLGSWLAVHHEDDPRLGPAARGNRINFDAPALSRLRAFLNGF